MRHSSWPVKKFQRRPALIKQATTLCVNWPPTRAFTAPPTHPAPALKFSPSAFRVQTQQGKKRRLEVKHQRLHQHKGILFYFFNYKV